MATSASFGDLLRRYRLAAGLTQDELAERAQMSVRGISDLERGFRQTPRRSTVDLLADALRLTPEQRATLSASVTRARPPSVSEPPTPASPSASFPFPLTSLIGRDREVAAILALVGRDDVRLVSLTGPGGVGKTRLAVHVAQELAPGFPGGACVVSLASVADPALVLAAIAQALRLPEAPSRPKAADLQTYLRDRELLLILDNFERVVDAASDVADLIRHCPRLKVLVTSTVALRVSGEREYVVPPLALPARGRLPPVERLSEFAALRLFAERAQSVRPGFAITRENAAVVAEICRRLDGLPLAIELAAARLRVLDPPAMLAHVERPLRFLTGGSRDLPERQQTLDREIAWSFELLDSTERALFRALSVFAGGFALDSVEAVCTGLGAMTTGETEAARHPSSPSASATTLDTVDGLVGQSLVQRVGAAAEPRFAMLETIREFAAERLRESGEAEEARRRHARHFLALAEAIPPEVWVPTASHDARLDRLEWEHENVQRALGWLAENPNAVLGLRWGAALGWFWWWRAYGRDDGAAEGPGDSVGRPGEGAPVTRTAALASVDRGARLARARATFGAAYAAWRAGDDATADALFEQSRAAWIDARGGDEAEVAHSQWGLELVVRWERLDALAQSAYEEALRLRHAEGDARRAAGVLLQQGWLLFFREDPAAADQVFTRAESQCTQVGDGVGAAAAHFGRGWVAHERSDLEAARAGYTASLRLLAGQADPSLAPYILGNCARLALDLDQPERAAQLAGAVLASRDGGPPDFAPAHAALLDRYVERARARLGDAPFAAARDQGAKLSLDQAIALAGDGALA